MASSKTYTGSCHCGSNAFSVTLSPPLEDPNQKVVACNCSICQRNGYLLTFLPATDVTWTKGSLDALTKYEFNQKNLQHYFCPTCGTSLVAAGGDTVGFSVRSFDDVDLDKLTLRKYDGKAL